MNDNFKLMIEALFDMAAAEAVKLADEKREPVADAATVMWGFGYSSAWLKHASPQGILGSAVEINRSKNFYLQLERPTVFQADSFGVIMNGELYEPNGDGWSFRKKYPNREKTADAAQYLWCNCCYGIDVMDSLTRYEPGYIREMAEASQKRRCAEVAANAWIAFDEGGLRDVLKTLSAERIKDKAAEAKTREVRKESRQMLGVLNIEGYGEHGQRVKVQGLPVYEPFNLDIESGIIKASAKACGITCVTNASFSSGPGIYY